MLLLGSRVCWLQAIHAGMCDRTAMIPDHKTPGFNKASHHKAASMVEGGVESMAARQNPRWKCERPYRTRNTGGGGNNGDAPSHCVVAASSPTHVLLFLAPPSP